jgi:predicted nuclease of restriction endonuclease-like RecB superfamily
VLTADLARSRTTADEVIPLFIDPTDARYRDTAGELIKLFEAHIGEPQSDLDEAIDQLTVADTDYKIIQGLAKLLRDECKFEPVAAAEPREIRQRLFERANTSYPIVRQPTLGADTRKLDVYSAVADDLGITLAECHEGMYADLAANERLVRFGDAVADVSSEESTETNTTTQLTDHSDEAYKQETITVEWLLNRYNLALAQAVLYDATELRIRVWDHFGTVFSYVKLFGLMHRIYPIDKSGERVASTDLAAGYEAILDGPASLFRQSRKYGIRMANFLPALPHCERWELAAETLADEGGNETRHFTLDHTKGLESHYSAGSQFDSDLERTFAQKWDRANTDTDG